MTAREGLKLAATSFAVGFAVGLAGFATYLAVAALGNRTGWWTW